MFPEDFLQRFWVKVQLCAHGRMCRDCCWIWRGARQGSDNHRYGVIWAPTLARHRNDNYVRATHIAWEMAHGPVPSWLWVLHNCPTGDNPACVNPAHLWLGTPMDNNHDMIKKGRNKIPVGEEHYAAKLTDPDIYDICALRGKLSQEAIARQFHITQTTVGLIQRGERWKHLKRARPILQSHAEQVATLTKEQVYAIRALQGQATEEEVAREFHISRSQIGRIWRRECWAWLE